MKQIILYFLLGLCPAVFSQTGKLTGLVLDAESKTPLELATVSILKQDSSLLTYQLTDRNGKFLFDKLPVKVKLLVNITYTGYTGFASSLELAAAKGDTLSVMLSLNNSNTTAVVVTTTIPIRMNGDTLEINPAAFKMKEDAVVEELLNQVSGVTIWSDGTITMNGRKVQNLLVDGKPFLGTSDSRVATQNLPKSAIDKIQLYQEYDRSNIGLTGQPQDSLLTMNIKLKDNSKTGYFGKAGAGYGTSQRFEADVSFQAYTKQTSAGVGGGINNINKNIGNVQEMFQNNTYRNYNPNLYNVGRFGTNGINRHYSLGGVFSHSFIETANSRQNNRVAVNYNTSGSDAYLTDINLQNRTTIANSQLIRDEGLQQSRNDRHDVGINYVKTNSYNDNLNLNGAVNTSKESGNSTRYTEVRDEANILQSTNRSISNLTRRTDNESVNGSFARSNNENPLKSFSLQFNGRNGSTVSERNVRTIFESLLDNSKNTSFNRQYNVNNHTVNVGGRLDYNGFKRLVFGRYNFFGITLNLNQLVNYTSITDNSIVSDYDSLTKRSIRNDKISNENKRSLFEYTPSLALAKSFFKWSNAYYRDISVQLRLLEDFKTDKNSSATFANRNLNRSFQFFRQEGSVSYQFVKQQKYQYFSSLNYAKNYEYPTIDQLYTIVDDINVYDVRVGNPRLRNKINHTLSLNSSFYTQNQKSLYSFNGSLGGTYNRSANAVTDSTINDLSGRRITYYVNADKSSTLNLNYNFNISRRFNKNILQLMYNGRIGTGKLPNYIDGFYNTSETKNLYNQFSLQFSLRSILIINLDQTLQQYETKQKAAGLSSFKNSNNSTKLGVVLNYPSNATFSTTVENIGNSNLNKPTILWNAFATYRFMKSQGELKASAMDLLKQYRNITNSVNSYGTSTRVTNGLQQFFLLTFSYYPRKFGKTELKKHGG